MNQLMSKRYLFFAISLAIIIPGITSLAVWGLRFSIDFEGGSMLEAKFASGHAPEPAQVIQVYQDLGIKDTQVSSSGQDLLIIRSSLIDEQTLPKVLDALSQKFNDPVTANRLDNVGPTLAQEVTRRGTLVVGIASVLLAI